MTAAVHAEWTKLRTLAGNAWLLLAVIALTIGLSTGALLATTCAEAECRLDPARLTFSGVQLGQVIVAVLAVAAMSGEYSTGMIRTTLAATPHRTVVLAAKALVITGLALVAGSLAVSGSLLAGRLILPSNGFTAAGGLLSLTDGPTLRAAVGSVLYLVLIALLSLGVAAAVRDGAAAIGVVLGLLYVFPIAALMINDLEWQRHLNQVGPMSAGLAIQATVGIADLPIGPWPGLGVLALWATAALALGGLLLWRRDA